MPDPALDFEGGVPNACDLISNFGGERADRGPSEAYMKPAGSSTSDSSGIVEASRNSGLLVDSALPTESADEGDRTARVVLKVDVEARCLAGLGVVGVRAVLEPGLRGGAEVDEPPSVLRLFLSTIGLFLLDRMPVVLATAVRAGFLFSLRFVLPSSVLRPTALRAAEDVGRVGGLLIRLPDARDDNALVLLSIGEAVAAFAVLLVRDTPFANLFTFSVLVAAGFAPAMLR